MITVTATRPSSSGPAPRQDIDMIMATIGGGDDWNTIRLDQNIAAALQELEDYVANISIEVPSLEELCSQSNASCPSSDSDVDSTDSVANAQDIGDSESDGAAQRQSSNHTGANDNDSKTVNDDALAETALAEPTDGDERNWENQAVDTDVEASGADNKFESGRAAAGIFVALFGALNEGGKALISETSVPKLAGRGANAASGVVEFIDMSVAVDQRDNFGIANSLGDTAMISVSVFGGIGGLIVGTAYSLLDSVNAFDAIGRSLGATAYEVLNE